MQLRRLLLSQDKLYVIQFHAMMQVFFKRLMRLSSLLFPQMLSQQAWLLICIIVTLMPSFRMCHFVRA